MSAISLNLHNITCVDAEQRFFPDEGGRSFSAVKLIVAQKCPFAGSEGGVELVLFIRDAAYAQRLADAINAAHQPPPADNLGAAGFVGMSEHDNIDPDFAATRMSKFLQGA